jgi:hypothetical protein
MHQKGMRYFESYWNLNDVTSLIINSFYITLFAVNIVKTQEYFPVEMIRIFGAFGAFTMWINIFYWMRLFADFAFYIKLIS